MGSIRFSGAFRPEMRTSAKDRIKESAFGYNACRADVTAGENGLRIRRLGRRQREIRGKRECRGTVIKGGQSKIRYGFSESGSNGISESG